jgi:phytoene/squalene synthetase
MRGLREYLKRMDADGHAVSAVVPLEARAAFLTLRIFNAETARIPDAVRGNEASAMMRFAFWEDLLEWSVLAAAAGPTGTLRGGTPRFPALHAHPLARPLAHLFAHHAIHARYLSRVLEARSAVVSTDYAAQTLEDVERYADGTSASLLSAHLEAQGVESVEGDWERAAHHAGSALTIAALLRGFSFHCAQRRVVLPVEIAEAHGLSTQTILHASRSGECSKALADAIFDFAAAGHTHLNKLRSLSASMPIPKRLRHPFLLALPAHHYFAALQAAQFNPFAPLRLPSPLSLTAQLVWYANVSSHLLPPAPTT